jgi:hypothetical protein
MASIPDSNNRAQIRKNLVTLRLAVARPPTYLHEAEHQTVAGWADGVAVHRRCHPRSREALFAD